MRILFAGTPNFAKIVLKQLLEKSHLHIVGLLTQPDRIFGRKKELKAPDTKEFLLLKSLDIPIFQPERIESHTIESIKKLNPDVIVVVAFGQILPQAFLDIAPCINIHASILPSLRGASPIQEMILAQPRFFGVSVMQMELGLDCGAVLGIGYVRNVGQDITELSDELAYKGTQVLLDVLTYAHLIKPLPQNHIDSSYCTKLKREYGRISLEDAQNVYHKYLAYKGWPSVFLESGLKFTHILGFHQEGNYKQGEILKILPQSALIGCERGYLEVASVQPPNKKQMSIVAYLLGARLQEGDCL